MRDFLLREWKFLSVLGLLAAALGVAYGEYREYREHSRQPAPAVSVSTAGERSKPGESQVVYVQGQNSHTREVVYVPKEVDPQTQEREKTDVQFERRDSRVYVKVNGKEFEVPGEVKEEAKFEKGKLVITERSEMRLNITAPQPAFSVGLGWSSHGPAGLASGPLYKNVAWWVYGDRKTVAGGLQFPVLK